MHRIPTIHSTAGALARVVLVILWPLTAAANDAALQKCRAVEDSSQRLKCYDAIPIGAGASTPVAAAVTPIPASGATAQSPSPATTSAPAPVPATTAASAPTAGSQFGLPAKTPDAEVNRIESYIAGKFEGWRPNSNIRLANGQVWQIADDTSRYLDFDNPKVAVRRGALTSFYLEIEGTNHSPRVRRVK